VGGEVGAWWPLELIFMKVTKAVCFLWHWYWVLPMQPEGSNAAQRLWTDWNKEEDGTFIGGASSPTWNQKEITTDWLYLPEVL
jgi:hypothetical protein